MFIFQSGPILKRSNLIWRQWWNLKIQFCNFISLKFWNYKAICRRVFLFNFQQVAFYRCHDNSLFKFKVSRFGSGFWNLKRSLSVHLPRSDLFIALMCSSQAFSLGRGYAPPRGAVVPLFAKKALNFPLFFRSKNKENVSIPSPKKFSSFFVLSYFFLCSFVCILNESQGFRVFRFSQLF